MKSTNCEILLHTKGCEANHCTFWDDLQLTDASNLTYKTEGVAPNRVFTAQWKNIIWQNGGSAAISFQLKLNETSNIVSFHYKSV
ncbi:MAG: hypothetical protein IPL23_29915 [Saprospiraceae bacterium]|nr:hypothetical protein [Saprospiraceae bacterium]